VVRIHSPRPNLSATKKTNSKAGFPSSEGGCLPRAKKGETFLKRLDIGSGGGLDAPKPQGIQ
jgi:hypothetical protein